jgi:hypothetical protein
MSNGKSEFRRELTAMAGGSALVLAVALAIAGVRAFDWEYYFSPDTISDYVIACQKEDAAGRCPNRIWKKEARTVYLVDANARTVRSQSKGDPPKALSGCTIVDKRNWQCTNNSVRMGFKDGKYWNEEIGSSGVYLGTYHVSKWSWTKATAN